METPSTVAQQFSLNFHCIAWPIVVGLVIICGLVALNLYLRARASRG